MTDSCHSDFIPKRTSRYSIIVEYTTTLRHMVQRIQTGGELDAFFLLLSPQAAEEEKASTTI